MQESKNIMEMAVQLGKAISECDIMKRFNAAREASLRDEKLGAIIKEYSVQKIALENHMKEEKSDKEFTAVINKRIEELYQALEESETMNAYAEAEQDLNDFMNEVNAAISSQLAPGTEEGGCSHEDCAHCSGCGHQH